MTRVPQGTAARGGRRLAWIAALPLLAVIGLLGRKGARAGSVAAPGGGVAAPAQVAGGRDGPASGSRRGTPPAGDVAPGAHGQDGTSVAAAVRSYLIGLALAALLTAGSFGLSYTDLIYGPGQPVALVVLAIAQIGVHLVFFLHLTTSPDHINNALALAFGVLIVVLLIGGTLWIMSHMNANMMPAGGPMHAAPGPVMRH
ncbi:cytochrome o ubiquinol oxidase subunit IV [Methylobacterium oryzisoli]|uniref:cytochrome o ubiquinol oxidase subunit IV n=1 Tax=Methylobacterium oryzisoli TaxID=3385502 RepID=UPI0038925422